MNGVGSTSMPRRARAAVRNSLHFGIIGRMKGEVAAANGTLRRAEIHWYEAHGVGKRGLKIKRFLD